MIKTLKNIKNQEKGKSTIPKSVQNMSAVQF